MSEFKTMAKLPKIAMGHLNAKNLIVDLNGRDFSENDNIEFLFFIRRLNIPFYTKIEFKAEKIGRLKYKIHPIITRGKYVGLPRNTNETIFKMDKSNYTTRKSWTMPINRYIEILDGTAYFHFLGLQVGSAELKLYVDDELRAMNKNIARRPDNMETFWNIRIYKYVKNIRVELNCNGIPTNKFYQFRMFFEELIFHDEDIDNIEFDYLAVGVD